MSESPRSADRPIAHYQILLPADWHAIPADDGDPRRWANDLAAQLTADAGLVTDAAQQADAGLVTDAGAARSLSERLLALHGRFARNREVPSAGAAFIPQPQTGRIACALAFQVTPRAVAGTPEEFQDSLNEEAATWQPGSVFRSNRTWRRHVPAGELVGSASLIAQRDLGEADEHLEQRAVFAVYPPGSSDLVQFIFSTQDLAAFDDMAQATEDLVASLDVRLQADS